MCTLPITIKVSSLIVLLFIDDCSVHFPAAVMFFTGRGHDTYKAPLVNQRRSSEPTISTDKIAGRPRRDRAAEATIFGERLGGTDGR